MHKKMLASFLTWLILILLMTGCGLIATPPAEPGSSQVAGAEDMTDVVDVVEEGMVPVSGSSLRDGTYEITADSSSSMFHIVRCELTVAEGEMTARMTMSGTGYLYVFMGTAEEAAGKELWYDRTLLFRADSLPMDAFADGVITTPESLGLSDGTYTVEVTLEGGSGRASVASPAVLTVSEGVFTAELVWSSGNYDYMKVGDVQYLPVSTEGNSVFEIPVTGFDYKMPVIADTTAMSQPYEIEYTLYFRSDSIEAAS